MAVLAPFQLTEELDAAEARLRSVQQYVLHLRGVDLSQQRMEGVGPWFGSIHRSTALHAGLCPK